MKKLLSISLSVAVMATMFSCTKLSPKNEGSNTIYTTPEEPLATTDPLYTVGRVPLSFTKKAVIEEVTGEWCGNCPSGAEIIHNLVAKYPDKVYAVAFHAANNEPFEIPGAYSGLISNVFPAGSPGTIGFPSASINRKETVSLPDYLGGAFDYRDVWESQLTPVIKQTASCGISIVAEEENDKMDIDVFVGYNNEINANTKLTLYLIEDNVPETAPGAQASGGGTANNLYVHQHLLRKIISSNAGDAIALNNTKDKYTKVSFKAIDIKGFYRKKDNLKLVAMVNVAGSTAKELNVLNAQQVALDEVKKWD